MVEQVEMPVWKFPQHFVW